MDNRTIKSKLELEVYLTNSLNYSVISKMDFNEYKTFVINLFNELNELKKEGLEREDIFDFTQNHYFKKMSIENETDVLFERRFSGITEELISFCADPMFWHSEFELFIKKWENAFDGDWYKKI